MINFTGGGGGRAKTGIPNAVEVSDKFVFGGGGAKTGIPNAVEVCDEYVLGGEGA